MNEQKYQLEDLRKWFGKGKKGDWIRVGTDGKIKGDCAREPGEGKPKCMPRSKAHSMSKKDRASAARRKRAADPNPDRPGTGNKPIMVSTDKKKKVNELSPDTLKRYRDKAQDNKDTHKRIAHDYATRTGDSKTDWTDKMAKVHARSAANREKGIARASKKIANEGGYRDPFKAAQRSAKYKELSHEYEREKQLRRQKAQKSASQNKSFSNVRSRMEGKTYFDFIAELTAKQRAEIEKRKASRMKTRGARRGPAKGSEKKDGDWDQKAAKPLEFEVKKNDHHSTVHKTIAKAADAMHPKLGGRKVALKIGGKTKVYNNHKDLQHVVDYHSKLKDKGQKANLMRSVRTGGHEAISKHTGVYRKVTKQ